MVSRPFTTDVDDPIESDLHEGSLMAWRDCAVYPVVVGRGLGPTKGLVNVERTPENARVADPSRTGAGPGRYLTTSSTFRISATWWTASAISRAPCGTAPGPGWSGATTPFWMTSRPSVRIGRRHSMERSRAKLAVAVRFLAKSVHRLDEPSKPRVGARFGKSDSRAVVGYPEVDRVSDAAGSVDHARPEVPGERLGDEVHRRCRCHCGVGKNAGSHDHDGRPETAHALPVGKADACARPPPLLSRERLGYPVDDPAPPVTTGVRAAILPKLAPTAQAMNRRSGSPVGAMQSVSTRMVRALLAM